MEEEEKIEEQIRFIGMLMLTDNNNGANARWMRRIHNFFLTLPLAKRTS